MVQFSFPRNRFLLSFFLLTLFFTLTSVSQGADFRRIETGQSLPEFSLKGLAGETYSREDLAGHDSLVVFWNIPSTEVHRDYSLEELITLQELAYRYGEEQGLKTLAVYIPRHDDRLEKQEIEEINSLKETFKLELDISVDKGLKLFNQFGVKATPSTILLNKKGEITFTMASYPWSAEKKLKEAVRKQLEAQKVKTSLGKETPDSTNSSEKDRVTSIPNQKESKKKFYAYRLMQLCCTSQ